MKKIASLLSLIVIISLAGCSQQNSSDLSVQDQPSQETRETQNTQQTQATLEVPKGTLALIPFAKNCDMERKALPIAGVCPKKNIMTSETAESYKTTFAVTSSEYGYANVRSTADFSGEESTESILVMLSDGQKFCSSGSVLARDADGAQMGIAYYVLLEDSKKQLCRGLVWEGLVKE